MSGPLLGRGLLSFLILGSKNQLSLRNNITTFESSSEMVPERTLDRLAIKKEQIICFNHSLTHYINIERTTVWKQDYYFAITTRASIAPHLTLPLSAF